MSQLPNSDQRIRGVSPRVRDMMLAAGYNAQPTAGHGTMAWVKEIEPEDVIWIDREFDIEGDPEAPEWSVGRWVGNAGVGGEAGYIGVGGRTLQEAIEISEQLPKPVFEDGRMADVFGETMEEALESFKKASKPGRTI